MARTANTCFSLNLSNIKNFLLQLVAKKTNHTVQSVQRRVAGWETQGSNPDEGQIFPLFHSLSNRIWDPPNLLYIGYRCHFLAAKHLGSGIFQTTPTDAYVKNGWSFISTSHVSPRPLIGRRAPYLLHTFLV
jgi:hypothetical protein